MLRDDRIKATIPPQVSPESLAQAYVRRVTHALEQRDRWRRAAPRWRIHQEFVRALTAPVSEALLAAAKPAPGETWLDVAAGVGDPAVSVVDRVAPSGRVVMTDLVPDMLRAGRDKVGDRSGGLLPVAAAAEALPVKSVFDGVTCRFGAMFFGDPPVALSEIRGALAPGGRVVFAVWGGREQNPYFTEIDGALRDVIPDLPVHEPDAPHVFRYSPRPGTVTNTVVWARSSKRASSVFHCRCARAG